MSRIKQFIQKIRAKLLREYTTEELIKEGLKVGKNFNRQRDCIIDESHCWLITIGNQVTLAPRVHILAHDASMKMFLGYTKIGQVNIGDNVFIGAGSIILPGVTIGECVVIGAGSVVSKDIPANSIAIGNPAKVITSLDEYLKKHKNNMKNCPIYDETWTQRKNISNKKKQEMKCSLEYNIGYIE